MTWAKPHSHALAAMAAACALCGCGGRGPDAELTAQEQTFASRVRQSFTSAVDTDVMCTTVECAAPRGGHLSMRWVQVANVGDADADTLWVYTNDHFSLLNPLTMMEGVPRGDAEKAIERILELRARYFRHHPPATIWGFAHHPGPLFAALGYGLCDDIAAAAAVLGRAAGLNMHTCNVRVDKPNAGHEAKPFEHTFNLVELGGRIVPLDFDHGLVWRNAKGDLASIDELAQDRQLASSVACRWVHPDSNVSKLMAKAFAECAEQIKASVPARRPTRAANPVPMRLCLPVGSRFTWLWSPVCAPLSDRGSSDREQPPNYANGLFEWRLDRRSSYVTPTKSGIVAAVISPYPMLDGRVVGARGKVTEAWVCDRFIEYPESVPIARSWRPLGSPRLFGHGERPKRRITLGSLVKVQASSHVQLRITVQSSKAAQPALKPGRNRVHIVTRQGSAGSDFRTATTEHEGRFETVVQSDRLKITFSYDRADGPNDRKD